MTENNIHLEKENSPKKNIKNPENSQKDKKESDIQNRNIQKKNPEKKIYKNYKHQSKPLTEEQIKNVTALVDAIESAGIDEFMEYIRSPWRLLWPNFVAGIARGIGALVGAAVIIALIGWILTKMINLPLIGKSLEPYIHEVQSEITKYTESTNYKGNFQELEKIMKEIRDELKQQNTYKQ